jgi:hypothetical protein
MVGAVADLDDVGRIARALPGAVEDQGGFGFSVATGRGRPQGFIWLWRERVDPNKARVPNPGVLAVRVPDLTEKAVLLAAEPQALFTEAHYDGYPAVLIRLAEIGQPRLEELIVDSWRCRASAALRATFDAGPA